MDAPLAMDGLVKRYGGQVALDGLDLQVERGEIFGFLGPNGAGKTTAIRVALGLLRPDAGRVRVLGRDPWRDGVPDRRRIGYLPGGPRFYERMRGRDLLDHLGRLGRAGTPQRARACELLGLSRADLRRPVREYSRGMRQKLGIVQAVQHDPELLVLDEPTEGLDPLVQEAFFTLLRERRAAGATVFFSSHVLSEVEALCERVGMVRAGRMVTVRRLAELKADRPRVVTLEFRDADAAAAFEVPGGAVLERQGVRVRLRFSGDPNQLVRALAVERLVDLAVEEPSLEEIFLGLYRDAGPDAREARPTVGWPA
jgi:ABC-2 type transport system ATP-binding protein